MPTNAEREEHAMTPLPFKIWCEHCMKGRGEERMHWMAKDEPEQAELHIDFCFPGKRTATRSSRCWLCESGEPI